MKPPASGSPAAALSPRSRLQDVMSRYESALMSPSTIPQHFSFIFLFFVWLIQGQPLASFSGGLVGARHPRAWRDIHPCSRFLTTYYSRCFSTHFSAISRSATATIFRRGPSCSNCNRGRKFKVALPSNHSDKASQAKSAWSGTISRRAQSSCIW